MKKVLILVLAAAMVLGVTACGNTATGGNGTTGSQSAAASSSSAVQSAGSAATSTPAEIATRETTAKLVMFVEGERVEVQSTLYQGNGYSLYIPDQGWKKDNNEDQWEAVDNDDVDLEIQTFSGKTMDETKEQITRDEHDYTFLDGDAPGVFAGTDRDGDIKDIRLTEGADCTYAVICEYPAEAAEGYGGRVSAMAETFEVDG